VRRAQQRCLPMRPENICRKNDKAGRGELLRARLRLSGGYGQQG
jgi:hypothetical protein